MTTRQRHGRVQFGNPPSEKMIDCLRTVEKFHGNAPAACLSRQAASACERRGYLSEGRKNSYDMTPLGAATLLEAETGLHKEAS